MKTKKVIEKKPFVKTVCSRFLKLLLANDSNQGFWERWKLESRVLPHIQIRLKNVHHYHKT